MAKYRTAWTVALASVGILGTWVSVTTWPLAGLVMVSLYATAVVGPVANILGEPEKERSFRRGLGIGAGAAVVVIGGAGIVRLLGAAGLVVIVMFALASPQMLSWVARRFGHATGQSEDLSSGVQTSGAMASERFVPQAPQSMDDASLCMAWRRSFVALQRASSPGGTWRIVQCRQEYLDEIERRNPEGFSAWLVSGARAAGDPSRYVIRGWSRQV